jgi:hypothetical protein
LAAAPVCEKLGAEWDLRGLLARPMAHGWKMTRISKAAVVTALALGIGLAACETSTPYQPLAASESSWGGYADHRLGDDRYQISFSANEFTPLRTVDDYLLYRAAELTVAQGYDVFKMADLQQVGQRAGFTGLGAATASLEERTYWRPALSFDPAEGRSSWKYGAYLGEAGRSARSTAHQRGRFQATAEIILLHGRKSADNPAVFDAHQVMASLAGTIKKPS